MNDDLLRSLSASRKMAEALRPQQAALDKLAKATRPQAEAVAKLGSLAKPSRQMTELAKALRRNEEATRSLRQAATTVRPSSLNQALAMEAWAEHHAAPLQTLRVVEAMLSELQAGAEREREMLRLTRRSVWAARIGVGVGAAGVISGVLIAVFG
jgi:hypothetical protein